jgi:hypothetical protein
MDLKTIEKGTIIADIMVAVIVIMLHLWGIIVFPYEGNFIFRIFLLVSILISTSIHLFYLLNFNLDYAKAIKYLLFVLIPVIVGSVILIEGTHGRLSDAMFETACDFFLLFMVAIGLIFGGEKHWEDFKEAIHDFPKSRQFRDSLYLSPTT